MDQGRISFTRPTAARVVWCAALTACPVGLLVMGLAVGQTGIGYSERPWPVRFINATLYVHAALFVAATVAAFRVWGRRWWVAWAGILVAGWIACVVAVGTLFSTVGYSL